LGLLAKTQAKSFQPPNALPFLTMRCVKRMFVLALPPKRQRATAAARRKTPHKKGVIIHDHAFFGN
jgi:hypothetical protein